VRFLFASIGLSILVLTGTAAQPPAPKPNMVWAYAVSANSVSLTHTEKLRGANKPIPPSARAGRTGRDVTGGGFVGAIDGVTEQIKGYKVTSSYKIGNETFRVWEPDNGPTSASSAPDKRFDDFDGTATASTVLSATGQYVPPNVVLSPQVKPQPPTYTFTGAARQSPAFQKDFKKRVEARLASLVANLAKPVALSAGQQKALYEPKGVIQIRPIMFFETSAEMHVTVVAEQKINIPFGR